MQRRGEGGEASRETRLMFGEESCVMSGLHGVDVSELVSGSSCSQCSRFKVCLCLCLCVCMFLCVFGLSSGQG